MEQQLEKVQQIVNAGDLRMTAKLQELRNHYFQVFEAERIKVYGELKEMGEKIQQIERVVRHKELEQGDQGVGQLEGR